LLHEKVVTRHIEGEIIIHEASLTSWKFSET